MNEQIRKRINFPSFKELCVKTWEMFQIEWQKKMLIAIAIIAATMLISTVREILFQTEGAWIVPLEIILQIISMVIGVYGSLLMFFVIRFPALSYSDLCKKSIPYLLSFLGLYILVTILTGLGFIALIVPGIVISTIIGFAAYELLFNNKKIGESIGWAFRHAFRFFWSIWYRWLGFSLITTVPFIILLGLGVYGIINGTALWGVILLFMILGFVLEYAHLHFGYVMWSELRVVSEDPTAIENVPVWQKILGATLIAAMTAAIVFLLVSIILSIGCMTDPISCPFTR